MVMPQKFEQNRRLFLKGLGVVGLAGSAALTACQKSAPSTKMPPKHCLAELQYEFFGKHQAGIITPPQRHIYFLVADLHSQNIDEIRQMFQVWTDMANNLTQGKNIASYGDNPHLPPKDTGEANSLGSYGLTLTFGVAPSFLTKLGLSDKMPEIFADLPKFARDQIRPEFSGGDICIQACSNDPQVAFYAIHQLVRQARDKITMRWSQAGFNSFDQDGDTPRNLFGFKDGTANRLTLNQMDKHIWVQDTDWLSGGSYIVVRKIKMHLETWDRTSLQGQEETFSRHKDTGAPLGLLDEFDAFDAEMVDASGRLVMPKTGHTALANQTNLQILRRSFSYSSGIDTKTGQFDVGLLFISFQKTPKQFIDIQNALGRTDKMNEYITHIGSGLFAVFGGVQPTEYLGQKLLG